MGELMMPVYNANGYLTDRSHWLDVADCCFESSDPSSPKAGVAVKLEHGALVLDGHRFAVHSHTPHVGNMAWGMWETDWDEIGRLLAYLHSQGWGVIEGSEWLHKGWERERVDAQALARSLCEEMEGHTHGV